MQLRLDPEDQRLLTDWIDDIRVEGPKGRNESMLSSLKYYKIQKFALTEWKSDPKLEIRYL